MRPYLLADAYAVGRGVPIDRKRALVLFQSAAEAGEPDAQTDLGYYLMGNNGFAPDFEQGFKWTEAAAVGGHAVALRNLAYYLTAGYSSSLDSRRTIQLWTLLAQRGSALAMWSLWTILSGGEGVPIDMPLAESWLRKAAAAGHADAVALLTERSIAETFRSK